MMHAMAGTLHLGTSGFSFDGWKHGVFYPEGLKNREMLSYYSQQLSSVEINYTFRRFPTEKSLTTWREQAADGFTFTLKANQRITHFKRLADTDEDVRCSSTSRSSSATSSAASCSSARRRCTTTAR